MKSQYRKRKMPLKLKNGIQLGQPAHQLRDTNNPSMPTTTPMMTASISQATMRSHQNANVSPVASATTGAVGIAVAVGASPMVTVVPQTGQYFAPSGSSFPHL